MRRILSLAGLLFVVTAVGCGDRAARDPNGGLSAGAAVDTAGGSVATADSVVSPAPTPDSTATPRSDSVVPKPSSASPAPSTVSKPPSSAATTSQAPAPASPAPASPAPSTTASATPATNSGTEMRDAYHAAPLDTVDGKTYQGWKYFNLNCARCHGEDVSGTTIAPHLIVSLKPNGPIPDEATFTRTVCDGRVEKGMPAWCSTGMTKEQIDTIYAYVKGRSDAKLHPGRPARKS